MAIAEINEIFGLGPYEGHKNSYDSGPVLIEKLLTGIRVSYISKDDPSEDATLTLKLPISILKDALKKNSSTNVLVQDVINLMITHVETDEDSLGELTVDEAGAVTSMLKLEKKYNLDEGWLTKRLVEMGLMSNVKLQAHLKQSGLSVITSKELLEKTTPKSKYKGVEKPKGTIKPEEAKPIIDAANVCTPTEIMHADKVKLSKATKLYQPVESTGGSSKYHVVAKFDSVVMAARLKEDGNLSLRVEGTGYENLLDGKDSGIDDKGSYASGHFHCGSIPHAIKTFGAVLMSLGRPSDLPFPELEKLKGVGK